MKFFHYAHLQTMKVRVGEVVQRNQLIGTVGRSGLAATAGAHLHFDVHKRDPKEINYVGYTGGLSRSQVLARWEDPNPYVEKARNIPAPFWTLGYGFLSTINAQGQLHSGIDINSQGTMDADIGQPVVSVCFGTVVYAQYDSGWGYHIFIKEEPPLMNQAKVVKSKNSNLIYVCYPVTDMDYLRKKTSTEGIFLPVEVPNSDTL